MPGLLSSLKAAGISGPDALKGIIRGRRPVSGYGDVGVNDSDEGLNVGRMGETLPITSLGPARIVDAGPNDEDDWEDERYWLRWLMPREGAQNERLSLAFAPDLDPAIFTATNWDELPADGTAGTHSLMAGRRVWVFAIQSGDGVIHYVFSLQVQNPFMVRVRKDGGVSGSFATATDCSWTYTLYELDGTLIPDATGKAPDRERIPVCSYEYADDDTVGIAYYDENGDIQLADALGERITTATIDVPTSFIVDDGSNKLQWKLTPCLVLDKGDEGSPVDLYTGSVCT